ISARSDFKKAVLDTLHEAGIEIVSPNFMNQRILKENTICIPPKKAIEVGDGAGTGDRSGAGNKLSEKKPEEFIFDKAIEAEVLDRLEKVLLSCEKKEKVFEQQINAIPDNKLKEGLMLKLEYLRTRKEEIKAGFKKIKEQEEESEEISDPESRSHLLQGLNLKADHLYIRRRKLEKELEKIAEEKEPGQA
ncbi:MAG: transport channel protein, partial [Methanosarcinaceae archaeon]|nr:transport channel protein [Methanosarcinaceae archaeon]